MEFNFSFLERFLSGSFVIFSKQCSLYNHIIGTYDARHNQMSSIEFRTYMERMRRDWYEYHDLKIINEKYARFPMVDTKEEDDEELIQNSKRLDAFIEDTWNTWNFEDIVNTLNTGEKSKFEYRIYFRINDELLSKAYLGNDGRLKENDVSILDDELLDPSEIINEQAACNIVQEMEKYVQQEAEARGIAWESDSIHFFTKSHRSILPVHLFTKDELYEVLRHGDDSRNNRLVIDMDGYVILIQDRKNEPDMYAVRHEPYNAYNNYVGPYANLNDIDEIYLNLLDCWLIHLQTGKTQYLDYYGCTDNVEELLDRINEYYK